MVLVTQRRSWRPSKLQQRVDRATRQLADREAARIPWPQLLKARELYVKWQTFLLWVRTIEDAEGCVPQWVAEVVSKRCPGFVRFAEQQSEGDRGKSSPLWSGLEQWINERIFAKPQQEGWMDAVGYYAVRDLAAVRAEAYWFYCDQQWKYSKPAVYPSFSEWRKASARCSDEVLDHFETTDELRELIRLSRQVNPRTLKKTVDQYIEWRVFAYWARTAFDPEDQLPDLVKHELERRCPDFLKRLASTPSNGGKESEDRFNKLLHWIEGHDFRNVRREGWLPVLAYQARLHPRLQRVGDYWHHWQRLRSENAGSRYPSFDQWQAVADTYTFELQDG